jgi:hypothetical protein
MKTLSQKTAIKKLDELTIRTEGNKPLSKTAMAYKYAKQVIEGKKEIRPVHTSGTGRFCSNQDHTETTKAVLTKIGIEFVFSNDSKRGGLTGNLLTITTKIKK